MRYLILGAALALAGCQSTTALVNSIPDAEVGSTSGMVGLINAERARHGLGPVRENARLSNAALAHAADMVANDYFSHTGANGSRFTERASAAGYDCAGSENLAFGQDTVAIVMTAWIESPGHHRNIIMADAKEVGFGRVNDVWVQMFGFGC